MGLSALGEVTHMCGILSIIMKGGTQGFPRHEVSDKQEVLFEDFSPSTAFSIRTTAVDELKMP